MTLEQSLTILIADDERIIRDTLKKYLIQSGHEVAEAKDGLEALNLIDESDFDLVLVDVRMPRLDGLNLLNKIAESRPELQVVIITALRSVETAIQALRLGAADFLTKPIKFLELDLVLEKTVRLNRLRKEKRHLSETIQGMQVMEKLRSGNQYLIGNSRAILQVREQIKQVIESGCDTILISGETGVGKEILAREIHCQANSDKIPFIAVSCPVLPETLIESELFGHTKGAFTGAFHDKTGYFELANGGTLFLDEVADLTPSAQAKFLRVLESRKIRKVGGAKEIAVNVQIIAATNANLEEYIDQNRFRRDLYYRLNVFTIHLAPLRERSEDILLLANHFLATYANVRGLHFDGFSQQAIDMLRNYDFPGNVRELKNLVERAAILCRSGEIQAEHFNLPNPSQTNFNSNFIRPTREQELDIIIKALEENKWNRRQTAKKLKIPYSTLSYKMKKLNIS